MGLFKNILSDAINEGIGKAVGKAVEKAVTPAAEQLAKKQAEVIDNASKKLEEHIEKAQTEVASAVDAVSEAAADATEAVKAAAEEGEATVKRELTPEEKEQAAQATQALKGLGMIFSGAIAQAKKEAEEEEAAKKAAEAAIFEEWETNLGAYPKWDVGGSEFELEELTPQNGHPAFRLGLTGRPFLVEMYAQKLRADGFVAKGSNPDDLNADTYYKIIDGVCHAFNRSDACCDGGINVTFYVDNYTPPKPKAEQANQPADELKNLAKGIFKKLF